MLKQAYAYGVLDAADIARRDGVEEVALLEFGVARGEGLLNLQRLAQRVQTETGVRFRIYGFDTGVGMPASDDPRDHPDVYGSGDFPMDEAALRRLLGAQTELILGDVAETVPGFVDTLPAGVRVGFVSIDVDSYAATRHALQVLLGPAERYLSAATVYFDDIIYDFHNSWQGELLALHEFNAEQTQRKIEAPRFFEHGRIFRRAPWVRQIHKLYLLDREMTPLHQKTRVLDNLYLDEPDGRPAP